MPATIEQLIHNNSSYKEHKESHSTSSSKSSVSRSAYLMRSLKNLKPKVPFHLSTSANINDPVTAHGLQYLDAVSTQRRGLCFTFTILVDFIFACAFFFSLKQIILIMDLML